MPPGVGNQSTPKFGAAAKIQTSRGVVGIKKEKEQEVQWQQLLLFE
jgi:hypothetical protein